MRISFEDVALRFEAVLSGELSRDAADRWAWRMMQLCELGELEYLPRSDQDRIWAGIMYLYGVDMPCIEQDRRHEFLLTDDDVRDAFLKIEAQGKP